MHNIYHLNNNPCITTKDIESIFAFTKKINKTKTTPTNDQEEKKCNLCINPNQKRNFFQWLPDEIILEVFKYLDHPYHLCQCSCVDRKFNQISDDPILWEGILKKWSRKIDYIRCYLGTQSTFGSDLQQDIVFKGVAGITKYYYKEDQAKKKNKKHFGSKIIREPNQGKTNEKQTLIIQNEKTNIGKQFNQTEEEYSEMSPNFDEYSSTDYTDPEDIKFFEKVHLLKNHPDKDKDNKIKSKSNARLKKSPTLINSSPIPMRNYQETNNLNKNINVDEDNDGDNNNNNNYFSNSSSSQNSQLSEFSNYDSDFNPNNEQTTIVYRNNKDRISNNNTNDDDDSKDNNNNNNNSNNENQRPFHRKNNYHEDRELRNLSSRKNDLLLQKQVDLLPKFKKRIKKDPKSIFLLQIEKVQQIWKLRQQTEQAFFQDEQKRKIAKTCLMFTGFRRQVFFIGLLGLLSSIFLLRKMGDKTKKSYLMCFTPLIVWSVLFFVYSFAQSLYGKLDLAQFKLARGNILTAISFVALFVLFPLKLDGSNFPWMILIIPVGMMCVSSCVTAHNFKDKKNYPGSWDINYFLGLLVAISLFHFLFFSFLTIKLDKFWNFSYGFVFMWIFFGDFTPLIGIASWPFLVILFDKNIKYGFRQVFHETSEGDNSKRFSLIVMFSLVLFFVFFGFFLTELLIFLKLQFAFSFSWSFCFIPNILFFSLLLLISCLYESAKFLVFISNQL
ncbi:fmrfamide receptor [Anaeramoeba flamelloides]|uniref:Fmrfamide receptor n=1 Tax=Anaeramoeba flamelloides TaxID=1746091 RepID=A0AAV7ZQB1_9EUKA|nr:fmrfamide receptor [Anaeramoeba flamelloides]